MFDVKSKIFLGFTKNQKSALCGFLRALVKKTPNKTSVEILDKFLEDESYYLEINASRFEFLKDILEEDEFQHDAKMFIDECVKYYEYKQAQAPLIQAQKDYEKKKRKFLQEVKMSKEAPTKKQLSYYKSLSKRYNEEMKDTQGLSRLDLRNEIDRILNEHKTD